MKHTANLYSPWGPFLAQLLPIDMTTTTMSETPRIHGCPFSCTHVLNKHPAPSRPGPSLLTNFNPTHYTPAPHKPMLGVQLAAGRAYLNPFRTAVPFWGQTTWNLTGLSPTTGLRF